MIQIFSLLESLIKLAVAAVIVLMLLRGLVGWLGLNPFGGFAYQIRRMTEPLVDPLRRNIFALHARRDIAPLLLVILVIIIAYFLLSLLSQIQMTTLYTLRGMVAFSEDRVFQGFRFLLGAAAVGGISIVITCIILQVFFSWVAFYGNWLTRTVTRVSEPVVGPFRRMIPPLGGMLDLSPLIAILVLSLLSSAIQAIFLA